MSLLEIRIALVLGLLVAGITPAQAESATTALTVIEQQVTKGRAAKTGYTRAQFPTWSDLDRNGCDTRNEILNRDLTKVLFKAGTKDCKVTSGSLIDPYSGKVITFSSVKSTIDIDHVVALSNAWQTGAAYFDKSKRQLIANDPLNLLAVDYSLNRQKGDGDAATWLPPLKSYRCAYVASQIAVKAKYALWVTSPEKDAIVKILEKCVGQKIPN